MLIPYMHIVLFSPESAAQFEKVFPSKNGEQSAFERSLAWAELLAQGFPPSKIALLCFSKNEAAVRSALGSRDCVCLAEEKWSVARLLEQISALAKDSGERCIVYASAACAFLDAPLSRELIRLHTEYKAEYTFADGYPAGFAPEIVDAGAASILCALCGKVALEQGKAAVTNGSIFDVLKSDINSFEIETQIASRDYRLLRMNFLCDCTANCLSAKHLAETLVEQNRADLLELDPKQIGEENVIAISEIAKECCDVLKTVPAFYNVQVNCSCTVPPPFSPYADFFKKRYGEEICSTQLRMPFERFSALVKKMKSLSHDAVVSLSLFGEAVLHPEIDLFVREICQNGLTAFVEIDGAALKGFVESEQYARIRDFVPLENRNRIIFAVALDSFSGEKFSALHGGANFQDAVSAIRILSADFRETYAQFTRTTQNEDELEQFFRAWSDASGATGGKIIIQKYDNFCTALPSIKTADLAPVVREPCWHLRRDMEILFDGSVPLCREVCAFEDAEILGNVFDSDLEELWKKKDFVLREHIQKKYGGRCGTCDEYYIFNF